MAGHRNIQIAGVIRNVIARYAVQIPPHVASAVSIIEVRVSEDQMYADVYVSAISGVDKAVMRLNSFLRDIRKTLAAEITTYKLPILRFHTDERGADLDRLDKLLDTLNKEPAKTPILPPSKRQKK